jgi:glucuronokinase
MAPAEARGEALARVALAGNPSDGYGGAVLAVTIPSLSARAVARRAATLTVTPPNALVQATARRLGTTAAIEWSTTVPESVGLGGSSAIVIATARALCGLEGRSLQPARLAELALAVEVEDLGIAAGLQDRVAQAYGGLTFMEFATHPPRYEPLDPGLLPPLVVAWLPHAAATSGPVHHSLRRRFEGGDPEIATALRELAGCARKAQRALVAGDRSAFASCVDGSFDARLRMLKLDGRHKAMIWAARRRGASANYTGSGGAIVAVCEDERHRDEVRAELRGAGCETIGPEWDR